VRRPLVVLILAFAAAVIAASAEPATGSKFSLRGTVTGVADGDTIYVRLDNGRRERVRLIGIDAPERGACLAAAATGLARRLAEDRRVVLRGDKTQDTRDRYGRLLAYAWTNGRDVGYRLVDSGLARVYVYRRPFQRLRAYRRAETTGRTRPQNVWRGCTTPAPSKPSAPTVPPKPAPPPPPPAPGAPPAPAPAPAPTPAPAPDGTSCDPSYPGVCIPPGPPDLDCADLPHRGFAVLAPDPHGFDTDADGVGCES
jgi:micrococcal nuclease